MYNKKPTPDAIIRMDGFTCSEYSTVPRIVVFYSSGKIFELKMGEGAEWRDISIPEESLGKVSYAEPAFPEGEIYGVSPALTKIPEVKKLNKKAKKLAKKTRTRVKK